MNDIPKELLAIGPGAALVVIDVQNDFCADGGVFAKAGCDLTHVQRALPRLQDFVEAARELMPVILVRSDYDDAFVSESMRRRRRLKGAPDGHCQPGTWGAELCGLAPAAGDHVVVKHRFSAFVGTDLALLLRSLEVSTLYHVGFFTNVCVESTVRDAAMSDLDTIVLADCTAALDDEVHEASLRAMDRTFGYVADSDHVRAAWSHPVPAPQPDGAPQGDTS